jgi:hypothetical protein
MNSGSALFPHANVVAGVLVLIVGFVMHWLAQLLSVIDWKLGTRLGLQEKGLLPEYLVYERAIAVADAAIGWVYGIAALGLLLNAQWGYALAWIPGSILVYHAVMAWFWERNRRAAGQRYWRESMRITWCMANLGTGALTLLVAWAGKTG